MSEELRLNIGGIGIFIKWEKSRMIDWPHPHYQNFVSNEKVDVNPTTSKGVGVNLQIHCGNLPRYRAGKMIFDGKKEGYWRLYRSNSKYVIEVFDTLTRKKNKVCFLEPDFRSGDVYIDPESERARHPRTKKGPFFSLTSLMQPLAEILLVNLSAKENGIMVHGLGISDRGEGIAFLGGTGRGKSTLAGFYKTEKGVNILSDEHIVIRKEKKQFRLYGTPWPGMAMTVSSESVPLNHIFFIGHASENRIFGRGTIADLLPLLFLPFWDKRGLDRILDLCNNLTGKMACRRLGFIKDRSVIEFVRKIQDAGFKMLDTR